MVFLRSQDTDLRNSRGLLSSGFGMGRQEEPKPWLSNFSGNKILPANSEFRPDGMSGLGGGMGGGMGGGGELSLIRSEMGLMRKAIEVLEDDRDNLRQAIRKLKVENSRIKMKLKKVATATGHLEGIDEDDKLALEMDDIDFADLKEYILIGGPKDPFSLRFEAKITDSNGVEHKSAERYLWYKMAETFGDKEAAERIQKAETGQKAEEEMGKISNFNDAAWAVVKMKHWEEGQRLKLEQTRWIQNLLVASDKVYIAVSSQDKLWGTGWRKQRMEASQPRLWDGENEGGKTLMRMRDSFAATHAYTDDQEKQEAMKKLEELKRTFWRRPLKRDSDEGPYPNRILSARPTSNGRGRGGPMSRGGRGLGKRGRY